MIGWGILGVAAWICVAIWPAWVAKKKGNSFFLWFIISLFFWWISLFWVYFGMKDKTLTPEDIAANDAADMALEREENAGN